MTPEQQAAFYAGASCGKTRATHAALSFSEAAQAAVKLAEARAPLPEVRWRCNWTHGAHWYAAVEGVRLRVLRAGQAFAWRVDADGWRAYGTCPGSMSCAADDAEGVALSVLRARRGAAARSAALHAQAAALLHAALTTDDA